MLTLSRVGHFGARVLKNSAMCPAISGITSRIIHSLNVTTYDSTQTHIVTTHNTNNTLHLETPSANFRTQTMAF